MAVAAKPVKSAKSEVPVAPQRRYEAFSEITEYLSSVKVKVLKYFDRSSAVGVIPQDALTDISDLLKVAEAATDLAEELKAKLVEHQQAGGQFAPGKAVVVFKTSGGTVSVSWKGAWEAAYSELARLQGRIIDLKAAEAELKRDLKPSEVKLKPTIVIGA